MLNAAVRVAPYTASGTPLASFSAGRLVRRLTHTLTYDGGVPLRSPAGLRVNTCTVACERGSSPTPYSPPSAETVSLRVNTRSCAYGGANSPAPYLHPVQRQLSCVGGVGFQSTRFAPNTIKGRCFFLSTIWAQENFYLRGKTLPRGPNKHLPVLFHKMAAISPNFPEEKRGGVGPHTTSRAILE